MTATTPPLALPSECSAGLAAAIEHAIDVQLHASGIDPDLMRRQDGFRIWDAILDHIEGQATDTHMQGLSREMAVAANAMFQDPFRVEAALVTSVRAVLKKQVVESLYRVFKSWAFTKGRP